MVAPLIAAAAGTALRGLGARAATGAASQAGARAGFQQAAGRAAQFGGSAIQRQAGNHQQARRDRLGPQDGVGRQDVKAGVLFGLTQPGLLSQSSSAFSSVLQGGQFHL